MNGYQILLRAIIFLSHKVISLGKLVVFQIFPGGLLMAQKEFGSTDESLEQRITLRWCDMLIQDQMAKHYGHIGDRQLCFLNSLAQAAVSGNDCESAMDCCGIKIFIDLG